MPDTPALIARFGSLAAADAARSALEAAGIEAFIPDENLAGINWMYTGALGGIRVMVRSSDAEAAKEILSSFAQSDFSAEASLASTAPPLEVASVLHCPECGSTETADRRLLLMYLVVTGVLIGVGIVIRQWELLGLTAVIIGVVFLMTPTHVCRTCSHSWTPDPAENVNNPAPEIPEPEVPCPRCGSLETWRLIHRRLKGATLLFGAMGAVFWIPILIASWPFLKKRECAACRHRW